MIFDKKSYLQKTRILRMNNSWESERQSSYVTLLCRLSYTHTKLEDPILDIKQIIQP